MKDIDLLPAFENYIALWSQVEIEYTLTPHWRMFRKWRLLNQMHRITKNYERWFNKWLENSSTQ